MLTVGSLFSGIGGFDLGFKRAGMRTAWFCEQDEFCRAVLAHHWPGVPCYPDITELRGADVDPVDILCGGFPCQDLSVAGAGAGLAGARSGLWSEYARLIGELRPRYVVVENVAALLARGLGTVLGDLAALGYDAEWDCIPASAVGAPHQRDRIWLVAYPDGDELREQPGRRSGARGAGASLVAVDGQEPSVADAAGGGCDAWIEDVHAGQPDAAWRGGAVADADCVGRHRRRGALVRDAEDADLGGSGAGGLAAPRDTWWSVEPDVGRVAHGVPARVDRLAALGNALVPQIAEWIGRRIIDWEGGVK